MGERRELRDTALEAAERTTPKEGRGAFARRIAWRAFLLLVTAVGLYAVWPSLMEVFSAWPDLIELHPLWLVAMLLLEIGSFVCLWLLLRLSLHTRAMFAVATSQLASNAFSRVVPGGGAAGAALQYQMLVRGGIDAARSATGLTTASLIITGAVFAMPLFALPAILGGTPVADGLEQAAWIGVVVFVIAFGGGAVLLFTDRPLELVGRLFQWVRNGVRRRHEPISDLPERLRDERNLVRRTLGKQWWEALAATVGKWGLDYLALLAALVAVGANPNPSLVLLAYVSAQILAMIPVTPGGLGFVEAGLTATLALAGVPSASAVLATLAYRLVSYWLPLPAGLVAAGLFQRRYGRARGSA